MKLFSKNRGKLIKYLLLLVSSITIGCVFGAFLVSGIFVARNHLFIIGYFEAFEIDSSSLSDFFDLVLKYSRFELLSIVLLFFSAFSVICYFVTDVILAFFGFVSSFFAVLVLRVAFNDALTPNIDITVAVIYIAFKAMFLCVLFFFACRVSLLSSKIKSLDNKGNISLEKKNTLWLIFYTLTALCGTITLKTLYGFTIFLIN